MLSNDRDAFWRSVFLSTAVYNVAAAATLVIVPTRFFVELGFRPVPEPTAYLHGFALAVTVFGLGYYWISRDLSERSLVKLGLLGKLGVFVLMLAHVIAGNASWHPLVLGSIDLIYALLFIAFLHRPAPAGSQLSGSGIVSANR